MHKTHDAMPLDNAMGIFIFLCPFPFSGSGLFTCITEILGTSNVIEIHTERLNCFHILMSVRIYLHDGLHSFRLFQSCKSYRAFKFKIAQSFTEF